MANGIIQHTRDIVDDAQVTTKTTYSSSKIESLINKILKKGDQTLINRPDQWEVGKEYDFGNGLYGQRYSYTVMDGPAADGAKYIEKVLDTNVTGKIIECGGFIDRSIMGDSYSVYPLNSYSAIQSLGYFASGLDTTKTTGLTLYIVSYWSMAKYSVDVWVKYIKQ